MKRDIQWGELYRQIEECEALCDEVWHQTIGRDPDINRALDAIDVLQTALADNLKKFRALSEQTEDILNAEAKIEWAEYVRDNRTHGGVL